MTSISRFHTQCQEIRKINIGKTLHDYDIIPFLAIPINVIKHLQTKDYSNKTYPLPYIWKVAVAKMAESGIRLDISLINRLYEHYKIAKPAFIRETEQSISISSKKKAESLINRSQDDNHSFMNPEKEERTYKLGYHYLGRRYTKHHTKEELEYESNNLANLLKDPEKRAKVEAICKQIGLPFEEYNIYATALRNSKETTAKVEMPLKLAQDNPVLSSYAINTSNDTLSSQLPEDELVQQDSYCNEEPIFSFKHLGSEIVKTVTKIGSNFDTKNDQKKESLKNNELRE